MTDMKEMVRVHYYNGQLLDARLFRLEQDYTTRLMDYHNQALFTPGVISGLNLLAQPGSSTFRISQGLAVDEAGRQLVWPSGGPPQTFPDMDLCPGEKQTFKIGLVWQERPVRQDHCPDRYTAVSLLPAVVFDNDQSVQIGAIAVVDGVITGVDNALRTTSRLKLPCDDQPPPPAQPATLAGSCAVVYHGHGHTMWVDINYKNGAGQPFETIPIVTATAVCDTAAFNISLRAITSASFQAGITPLQASCPAGTPLTINWMAAPPGICTVQTGGAS